ncbi:M28 family metallopeptidase [Sphingomonas turrisvirgatae]|uniref:Aminopeptidase n=1 Tax=Sphingomonas turrisvirgatae TaxID=1888892 RepID=A0A1E3LS91_9SPHN|nr:M28 family metallopeptidase [Sphingomonas turrisvirgatae]ODP36055.1 aminopeptidase [Sphingomonas turrisvirgatae]
MFRPVLTLALLSLSTALTAQEAAPPAAQPAASAPSAAETNARLNAALPADQAAMKAHVMFLASDAMRGREAGSNEYEIAAQYVAAQFYAAGLKPAGIDGSYLQPVPLLSSRPVDKGTMTLTRGSGAPVTLTFGEDYLPTPNPEQAVTTIDAPVVFAGYGIVAPQYKRDDYKGVDVRGKVVAIFSGAPGGFDGEERAHFGGNANKAAIAAKKGAAAVLILESPTSAKVRPFARLGDSWQEWRMTWADAQGRGYLPSKGTPILGTISLKGSERLFAGDRGWAGALRDAEAGKAVIKPFASGARLAVSLKTETKVVTSSNVAGMIPGSDPKLKDEVVVLTAHLDHVGVGKADKNGDTIYNGAMDNAMGIASLIEEAKRFQASGKPPRRSVMFLAVTAEEKGLIGADYFANNPTVPKDKIVANVNLDMPVITYKFEDMIAFGAARSTLGEIVARATASVGVGVGTDPMPEQGFFVRSDHYRFVQQGVPSVFLWPGMSGAGGAAFNRFLAERYHRPSDEVTNPDILWDQGVRFIAANYAIAREIADADARPAWKKGDFFGTLYGGYGAK